MNEKAEYWDLYNDRGKLIRTMRRGDGAVPRGLHHITVEVIATDCNGHILVTQRDFTKERGAGKWEFPAGSALSGETARTAAIRELKEETGLKATSLIKIQERHIPGMLRVAYLAYIPKLMTTEITLQPGETANYKVLTIDDWFTMVAHGMFDSSRTVLYGERFYNTLEAKVNGGMDAPVPEGSTPYKPPKPSTPAPPPQKKKAIKRTLTGTEQED